MIARYTSAALFGLLFAPALLAQGVGVPPNDDCGQPIPLECGAFISGSTETATDDGAPECVTSVSAPGIWYSFTGISGTVILSTCADHGYDTKINVYTGECDDLVCIAGNDDGPNTCYPGSEVVMVADPGTTYKVLVQGYNGATGTFSIQLDCPVCQPPGNVSVSAGDVLAQVYWSAANPGSTYHIEYGPAGFTPGNGTEVTGVVGTDGPPALINGLVAGTDYEVYLYEDCGGGEVSLTRGPVAFTTSDQPLADNAFCSGAAAITCGGSVIGNTDNGIYSPAPWCASADVTAKGLWYGFIGDGSEVTLSTCGQAGYDTKISVFTGGCAGLECVAGNDDGAGCGTTSRVTFLTANGSNYFVLVHGYQENTGDFTLSMTCTDACSPGVANEECSSAQVLTPQLAGACVPLDGTNTCAYTGAFQNPPCDPYAPINDVWYVLNTGISTDHTITVDSLSATALGIALYGGCAAEEFIACYAAADGPIVLSGLLANTDYLIRIWNHGGAEAGTFTICDETSVIDGVADVTNVEGLRVWPVPASDELNVSGVHAGARTLTLIDASGRTIRSQRTTGSSGTQRMLIDGIAPGPYLLRVDGTRSSGMRVIIR